MVMLETPPAAQIEEEIDEINYNRLRLGEEERWRAAVDGEFFTPEEQEDLYDSGALKELIIAAMHKGWISFRLLSTVNKRYENTGWLELTTRGVDIKGEAWESRRFIDEKTEGFSDMQLTALGAAAVRHEGVDEPRKPELPETAYLSIIALPEEVNYNDTDRLVA